MRFRRRPAETGNKLRPLILFSTYLIAAFASPLVGIESVSAHARLLASTPTSGTALSSMPAEIVLTFSEEVDLAYSAANLLTVLDQPVALATFSITNDKRELHVPLADATSVPPGTYVLVWRVFSSADGHVTTGTITFSAGTGMVPEAGTSSAQSRPPWWRIAVRWSELVGLVIMLGGFFFSVVVARQPLPNFASSLSLLLCVISILLAISLLLAGYDAGLYATGSRFLHPPEVSTYRDLVLHSTAGRSWLAIVACAALMIVAAAIGNGGRRRFAIVGLGAGLIALFSLSYAGHAAATSHLWRSIAIDWIHLSAVACWFGTLPYLWLNLRFQSASANSESLGLTADTISRFSRLGLLLMGTIIATGFLRAADQVAGARSLTDADYGRVLIAKHLLLVPVLVAAGANVLVIVPRLRAAQSVNVPAAIAATLKSVPRFVGAEIIAAMFILLAAGALTELAPADGPLAVDVATRPTTIDQRAQAGDLSVWLLGRLTGAANDRYTITVAGSNGKTPENIQRVIIQTSIDVNGAQVGDRFDAQPLSGSSGTYVFPALRLGLRGLWNVDVITRRAGVEDVSATLQVDTANTGTQPPRLVDDSWRMPRVPIDAWLLVACSLIVLVGGIVAIRRLPGVEPFAIAIIMTMVALITAGFAVQGYRRTIPVSAGTTLVKPVIADAGSVQRGEGLYSTLCLQCHGAGGVGIDDSDPEHSHSSGTNLTDSSSEKQRDGDLYWAISTGIGGTDMPAFDIALSDEERWDLVNYLRMLQTNNFAP